jgi:hypothetical protein
MPKGKIQDPKRPDTRKRVNVVQKFKIGNRKSTRSATRMSNEELRGVLSGSASGKDKQIARNELERRGAALVLETKTEEEVAV